MRCWPFRVRAALATMLVLIAGCRSESRSADSGAPARPNLPDGEAGRLLQRAIDAEGGWERWRTARDVSYISMLTDRRSGTRGELRQHRLVHGAAARRRAGAHGLDRPADRGALRHRCRANVDRQRRPAGAGAGTARAHALRHGQQPVLVLAAVRARRAAGRGHLSRQRARTPTARTWQRLQAEFRRPDPAVPGRWFVLYIDAETGLIDRVHGAALGAVPAPRAVDRPVAALPRLRRHQEGTAAQVLSRRCRGRRSSATWSPSSSSSTCGFNNGYGPDALSQAAGRGDDAARRGRDRGPDAARLWSRRGSRSMGRADRSLPRRPSVQAP